MIWWSDDDHNAFEGFEGAEKKPKYFESVLIMEKAREIPMLWSLILEEF